MSRLIIISLPVVDLPKAVAFYTALGLTPNPQITDDTGAYMIWGETLHVMLLTHAKWQTFTTRPIAPRDSSEVALGITCASRAEVDTLNRLAGEHGGTADINPVQDHGTMYGRDFLDPDGHAWGAMWMDMAAMGGG